MQAMLLGVRRVDMTDQKSGRPIKGFSCFIAFPSEGVEGEETSKVFVSDDFASLCAWSPEVGMPVNLDFTPKGKICRIETIRSK